MKSLNTNITLYRKKIQFSAGIALTMGALNTGKFLLDRLHPKELAVYHSYLHTQRKKSYLLGRFSAKEAVCSITKNNHPNSIWIDTGVFQFPVVKGIGLENIQVSISHTDTMGFSIAYPEAHPMGIDVEKINLERTDVVLSQLTEQEKQLLKKHANTAGFTAIFSIKEALSKVIKTGMMLEFRFLELATIKEDEQILEGTFTHFGQYKAFAYLLNGYVFSIVLPKRTMVNLNPVWQMLNFAF